MIFFVALDGIEDIRICEEILYIFLEPLVFLVHCLKL